MLEFSDGSDMNTVCFPSHTTQHFDRYIERFIPLQYYQENSLSRGREKPTFFLN
jgi:hypothetical protein